MPGPQLIRVKFDEVELANRVIEKNPYESGLPDGVEPTKRVLYILEKWSSRGWWDYGVSIHLGWMTPAGASGLRDLYCDVWADSEAWANQCQS